MAEFLETTAAVGSDEEEEEFDEETGEVISSGKQKGTNAVDLDDSSEEDDDDDDEEAQRIREGFIVDEDEDEDVETQQERKRQRKKRRREQREEEEELDEEDLDLIGETMPGERRQPEQQSKFKRLKRGHRDAREASVSRGVEDIFSDEEDGDADMGAPRRAFGGYDDEMDGFIEQDEFPDEDGGQMDEDMGVRAPRKAGMPDFNNLKNSGLGEAELEDMLNAFGNGEEFIWALEAEKAINEESADPDKPLELKDVFEPSQLEERMLTDRDNEIRLNDVPERFQLARAPYKDTNELSDEQLAVRNDEEASWISSILFPRKRMDPGLRGPFETAVKQVLQFMNVEDLEPAFIVQNRKDYLIHSEQVPNDDPNGPPFVIKAEKLLNQTDLWDVLEQDLKYRAFAERRDAIQKNVELLKEIETDFNDEIFNDLIPLAAQLDDLQDLQDYLNFQYSIQLKDLSIAEAETNGTQKRARGTRSLWDKVRSGPAYHLVRAFGITADAIAQNAENQAVGRRRYTEDPDQSPEDIADTLIRDPDYKTGEDVLAAAKAMFVEEIVMSPRMRRHMRKIYYENLVFDCFRTEKGLKQINEEHPYYEFKYLRNQEVRYFLVEKPELFLRMLKAEADGLVEVRVKLRGEKRIKLDLQKTIESDNFSAVADAWNALRREVLDTAVSKMHRIISKGVKDNLKNECENKIGSYCRDSFTQKLDQAPYKPKGMELGTHARVLALSNGAGNRGDAICWAYVDENGAVKENGKFADLRPGNEEKYIPDGKDIASFKEVVQRRRPDVIAVSGWSVETYKLYQDLKDIVRKHELHGAAYEDPDEDREVTDPLEVIIPQDEVARLYWTSDRSAVEHPGVPPLTRYCIALALYMQNPMKQYAALKKDITSITFDPNQNLLPEDKLRRYLETAMVDIVNLVGVDVNEAVHDSYTANLLPYVCGLGPRKADNLIKAVTVNGGEVANRADLVGDLDRQLRPAVGPKIWTNCGSFLYITWEDDPESDYLDNTRIHPEDYEIARKMAADALELDEEDIKAEQDDNGMGAVVRRLIKEEQQDKVNDLVLEQYAKQLEEKFHHKKRATLETIRAELQNPYEELRRNFNSLTTDELFTQLTGETRESLTDGMMVSVSVKRTFPDHIEVKLECGIDGGISETEYPEEMVRQAIEPRRMWSMHQVIQAKLSFVDRKKFTAQLTLRESEMRKPFRRNFDHGLEEWDDMQEEQDQKAAKKAIESKTGRQQRVIKHPLFRPFNSTQAIEALQTQNRGDCIIRPSSKGPDHLAVTWKIADGVYQHIDVLELDKENEFSVGRTLKVGKYSYSDLDELIVLHVQAMAKKVDEMTNDERFQNGTKEQTEQWLTTYTEANPKRSMYAFCLNRSYPGYFYLCFKAGYAAPPAHWAVKVIPQGFELRNNKYPDVRALKNGFKLIMSNMATQNGGRR
ncbi:Transcription elongation factor [Sphaerulina musiva]